MHIVLQYQFPYRAKGESRIDSFTGNVVERHRFDADMDPNPNFHFDADSHPDPDLD
jgi:hypothetical protein